MYTPWFREKGTCVVCGAKTLIEYPDRDPLEPGDDSDEQGQATDAESGEEGHKHLCGSCLVKTVAPYLNPTRPAAGTLAEALIRYHYVDLRVFLEELGADREVLQRLSNIDNAPRLPASWKAKQLTKELIGPLARVGRPVAIIDPHDGEEEDDPVSFLIFGLNDSGGIYEISREVGDLLETGAVNALDYAPDGSPIDPER